MGIYLNPGNMGFKGIINGDYIDKTGLIAHINNTINKSSYKMTCFSRLRRFGKSFAAKMLCAYYDKSCDSRELFEGLEISKDLSFEEHLNKYNVIYLDITRFTSFAENLREVVKTIQSKVIGELKEAYPEYVADDEKVLGEAMASVSSKTGEQFIFIIDEWDAIFRESKNDSILQKEYLQLLRGLFKGGTATDGTIAAAYMTGILPIKRYGTESALTDFREFTMVRPHFLVPYLGFTEDEVKRICEENNMDFNEMKSWYDGYYFKNIGSVYNPNSVMSAVRNRSYCSYWTSSETYESLKNYIAMNFDGLKDAVIAMLGGQRQRINPLYFQNDLTSLKNKNNVLTLLVHLGYLSYDEDSRKVCIPNLEVRDAFEMAVQDAGWDKVGEAIADSEDLLEATINGDSEAVENALEEIHSAKTSILKYNDENSLACAVSIAYYTAERYYEVYRELPTGKGFADLVFIPHKNTNRSAVIVELKYNKTADSAIKQIKERRYEGKLKTYEDNLLLVGVNYDRESTAKKHSCVIEKFEK
ncbi:MAG: ATP-binding protein [Clostridiales bacterium]|nr:ATP-binding protein [Clostridiales bacterium]